MGLELDFELATLRAALTDEARLPGNVFLSLNVSPGLVLHGDRRFRQLVKASRRPLVLELTEHVQIDDYGLVRDALVRLGDVRVAVDDAGAGYSSFRHILELRPTYAKLDISLVRAIDVDNVRQALAAGLPVITTKGTPWNELETEGCGWWTSLGVDPLVDALQVATTLSDGDRAAMGVRGRRWVGERFGWARIGEEMRAVYGWILNGGAVPASIHHV